VVGTADEGKSVTLQGGNCRLALYQGILGPAETQLIFWNGDVEACAAAVTEAGVEVVSELRTKDKGDASVMFRDPNGQLVYVIRMNNVSRNDLAAAAPDLDRGAFQVSLPVKDLATTVAFYETLGFHDADRKPEERVLGLSNGRDRLCLYQGYLDPKELQLIFWQGDIDAVADTARREGLDFFHEPRRDDTGAAFMLKDPDGRPLFFITMGKYTRADFAV
jgi:catechol 2,3-dioxygenase-like lactoylglutathione lyase family enzyme